MNMARTRKQRRDVIKRYQELNREVKKAVGEKRGCMWTQRPRELRKLERGVI